MFNILKTSLGKDLICAGTFLKSKTAFGLTRCTCLDKEICL